MVALPSIPVIYSFRRCPYAMRARLALLASEQICEHREILLRDKPASMLTLSPKGTVPVMWLPDGRVLDESLDVMYWALHKNDPLGWLEYTSNDPSGGKETGLWSSCQTSYLCMAVLKISEARKFCSQRCTCSSWVCASNQSLLAIRHCRINGRSA